MEVRVVKGFTPGKSVRVTTQHFRFFTSHRCSVVDHRNRLRHPLVLRPHSRLHLLVELRRTLLLRRCTVAVVSFFCTGWTLHSSSPWTVAATGPECHTADGSRLSSLIGKGGTLVHFFMVFVKVFLTVLLRSLDKCSKFTKEKEKNSFEEEIVDPPSRHHVSIE